MKDIVEVSQKLDTLQSKMKILEDGYIPINHKKFQVLLKDTLKDLFRDEEKIAILREIRVLGFVFSTIVVLLLLFVIYLITFTTPI